MKIERSVGIQCQKSYDGTECGIKHLIDLPILPADVYVWGGGGQWTRRFWQLRGGPRDFGWIGTSMNAMELVDKVGIKEKKKYQKNKEGAVIVLFALISSFFFLPLCGM